MCFEIKCIDCAYLCHRRDGGDLQSWNKAERYGKQEVWLGANAQCFKSQWSRSTNLPLNETVAEVLSYGDQAAKGRYRDVKLANGKWLELETPRECDCFHAFDPKSTKPLERISQEHEQQLKDEQAHAERKERKNWAILGIGVTSFVGVLKLLFGGGK